MRVLVIGSGGREHALCWAIAASPLLTKLWCAPGNPGIAHIAECVSIGPMDVPALVAFAKSEDIDLVVPGPEGPLVAGISDAMEAAGISCCGPSRDAVWLESSKSFTKEICAAAGIPTAHWAHFDDAELARAYVRQHGAPIVVKADGLAAGKGVVVATTEPQALAAIDMMMAERTFGTAGDAVLIEECLAGEEVSFFALCYGTQAIPFGVAQDHKRVGDGDTGPNTGGMGAYSPVPIFPQERQDWTMEHIIHPTLAEMAKRGAPYRGILFAGLMVTDDGVKLIEFNTRFGDPECQALVLRMKSDLLAALCAACDGTLDAYTCTDWDSGESETRFRWSDETAISVVMAAPGYPDAPVHGSTIGLTRVSPSAQVFHAGTEKDSRGHLRAVAGRVLTVCATGADLTAARASAYAAIDSIDWPEGIYRRDIGWRATK